MNCSTTAAWITSCAWRDNRRRRRSGPVYSDSDIYKWVEAVGFALQSEPMPHDFAATTDAMIRDVVAAQEPSGYLNTYYDGDHKSAAHAYQTQTTGHELY